MAERIASVCDGCQVTDAHSRHIQYAVVKHPVTGKSLDISISKHIQCCASAGCAVCAADVEFAPIKEIGDDFTAYTQSKTAEHLAALASRHGIASPAYPLGAPAPAPVVTPVVALVQGA